VQTWDVSLSENKLKQLVLLKEWVSAYSGFAAKLSGRHYDNINTGLPVCEQGCKRGITVTTGWVLVTLRFFSLKLSNLIPQLD
jgi:hypothetical protein